MSNPNFFSGECPVWLYDTTIEDLQERNEKKLSFPTASKAANFLGYASPRAIHEKLKNKWYVYDRNGKKYAVRKAKPIAV